VVADPCGVLVMPADEAEDDIDWALGKQAAEPDAHRQMLAGARLGERSGASALVEAKLKG
jgi:regulator of RNase E activity RraA